MQNDLEARNQNSGVRIQECKHRRLVLFVTCLLAIAACSCQRQYATGKSAAAVPPSSVTRPLSTKSSPQLKQFIDGAVEQSKVTTGYDPSYVKLDYPNGDVASDTGVCSDVVVRAFRKAGIDLQKEIHEDMVRHFAEYPLQVEHDSHGHEH